MRKGVKNAGYFENWFEYQRRGSAQTCWKTLVPWSKTS